jgi:hypothetical protein
MFKKTNNINNVWLATADYFANSTDNFKTFKISFEINANNESEALALATQIYNTEFGPNSKAVAQQDIADTNALSVIKA